MTLNQYTAEKKLAILEDLRTGQSPREGSFDPELLKEARVKGQPQMGTTRYEPEAIVLEFIYPDPRSSAAIVSVRLDAPERIVFLPVPTWVVESIWQGDISGTFHFESEAMRLMQELREDLTAEGNRKWFEKQTPKRRE